ncbi:DUF402 domain-containing protein [Paenibacillus albiflavus]|nr:DUF402 domain-containing protein [Paenibacillus albiflavus]
MKRKYAKRSDWKRILEREYKQLYVEDVDYTGTISMLILTKVREPLFVSVGDKDKYCVADNGYKWLQYFPNNSHYSLTVMFNAQNEAVQWYYDVSHKMEVTDEGEPYFVDLYLDVVVLPNREVYLLDEDELQEALDSQEISIDEYHLAKQEATRLIQSIEDSNNVLMDRCYKDLATLEAL